MNKNLIDDEDLEKIILHEKTHALEYHSFDKIFIEIITIFQWFNPFVWAYRQAIIENHEYLADSAVLEQNSDTAKYKMLLINQLIGEKIVGIANHFNFSLTKKRIIMMTNVKSPAFSKLKLAVILPAFLLLFYFVSCSKKDNSATVNLTVAPSEENKKLTELEKDAYFQVETMPEFIGGINALQKYITDNVQFPTEAMKKKIEGKVFIRFRVTDKGSIDKVTVERAVHDLLDKEAIRVVNSMPKWKPGEIKGKPVHVWFVMPINFKLQ